MCNTTKSLKWCLSKLIDALRKSTKAFCGQRLNIGFSLTYNAFRWCGDGVIFSGRIRNFWSQHPPGAEFGRDRDDVITSLWPRGVRGCPRSATTQRKRTETAALRLFTAGNLFQMQKCNMFDGNVLYQNYNK